MAGLSRRLPAHREAAALLALASLLLSTTTIPGFTAQGQPGPAVPSIRPMARLAGPIASPTTAHPRATDEPPAVMPVVNPYSRATKEPVPVGIADYGVQGTTTGYAYTTPSFQGTVRIGALAEYYPFSPPFGGYDHYVTFQENLVLRLHRGAQSFYYWPQNIAGFFPVNGSIHWFSNLWNFTRAPTTFSAGELVGNGSLQSQGGATIYAAIANTSLPGASTTISYPATIGARLAVVNVSGYPHLLYEYDDGYGWVTWDNVTFARDRNFTIDGFVVDGFHLVPSGYGFQEAEWVLTGGTTDGHVNASDLSFALEYWNGHNFESVPSAWNFGGETSEAVSNASMAFVGSPTNGTLYSRVSAGNGSLGPLYNGSDQSILNVSAFAVANGTLRVGGQEHRFVGGNLSLRLAPGTYPLELLNGSTVVGLSNASLGAGQTVSLTLPTPFLERVNFQETGLPNGTAWSVAFRGNTVEAIAGANGGPSFLSRNGSFAYRVTPVPGFVPDLRASSVEVSGPTTVHVNFSAVRYQVTFTSVGRPAGLPWTVEIAGSGNITTANASLSVPAANGTLSYAIEVPAWFLTTPANGTVLVAGGDAGATISFSTSPGTIRGLVDPGNASVTVDGQPVVVTGGAFELIEPPGTYLLAASLPDYHSRNQSVVVTAGNQTPVWLNLTAEPSPVGPGTSPSAGLTPAEVAGILLAGSIGAAAAAAVALRIRRGPAPPGPGGTPPRTRGP